MGNPDSSLNTLKKFSYNVVRLPRTGITPLQILEKQDNDLVILGELSDLFVAGAAAAPAIGPDEQAPFINGQRSDSLKLSVGLTLLGGIIGAMTGSDLKLEAAFQKATSVAFLFDDVKLNQVNLIRLSKFLTAARIDESAGPPALLLEADKLYVITSILKSQKFTIEAQGEGGVGVDVDVPIIKQILGGKVGVKTAGSNKSRITFEGPRSLVFGFQAVRMEFEGGRLKGLKHIDPGKQGLRAIAGARDAAEEDEFETLTTDSPFANLVGATGAAPGPRLPGKKSPAKKATAKKATTKKAPARKAAKPAKKAAKKAAKRGSKR